jgi:hypothetical protein
MTPIPPTKYLLYNLAQKLFGVNTAAWAEPPVATFSRGIVDLNNNLLLFPSPINIVLNSAYTLANPVGAYGDGARLVWRLQQDATGGRPVTLGSKFRIPSSGTSPLPFSTAANAIYVLAAMYNAQRDTWDVVSFVPGY